MNLMNKVLDTIQELYHNKDIVYVTLSNWLKNHFIGGVKYEQRTNYKRYIRENGT